MATIHNPTNFEPSHYDTIGVYDNKRPQYYGQGIAAYEAEVADWQAELASVFGPDWTKKIHHCAHCGNGRVRWITATTHIPTGETVVFGSDCTARLGFDNKWDFKLAQLKAKAEAGHAKMKIWKARCAYLEANPALATAVEQAKNPLHAGNSFVQDVISKLNQYGYLTERQAAAVLKSLARDVENASRKAAEAEEVKGDAPTGRVTVTGTVLSTKNVEGAYGWTTKMLLKLENNSRVWLTVPKGMDTTKGNVVTLTATFTLSKDDKSFAFGSRPSLVSVTKAA